MRKKTISFTIFSILLLSMGSAEPVAAQRKGSNDTNYYETYRDKLTARLYLSQKFVKFTIPPSGSQTDLEYKANTKMNLGLGFSFHGISANIFYGFAFLNKDTAKGETKGLDLQFHLYPHKWAIDLLVLFPKGYYVGPKGYASSNPSRYYYRPDVKLNLFGISAYYVPNKERFSYRAAITQNEWQKKSAGSLLYGGTIYYGTAKGDSALVPKSIESAFPQKGIDNINFMAIGGGIGYAGTLVMDQHFFITASLVTNLDLTLTSEENGAVKNRKTGIGPSMVAKAAVGYNSPTWNISMNGLSSFFWTKGQASPKNYYLPVGALRLVLSRKFDVKKKGSK